MRLGNYGYRLNGKSENMFAKPLSISLIAKSRYIEISSNGNSLIRFYVFKHGKINKHIWLNLDKEQFIISGISGISYHIQNKEDIRAEIIKLCD